MSEKAKTNKKWVSSTEYREQYDKIFKKISDDSKLHKIIDNGQIDNGQISIDNEKN